MKTSVKRRAKNCIRGTVLLACFIAVWYVASCFTQPLFIQVEGNINARNYSDSGQALSAERAKAVAKYFIACGIDPNRLITVGNGNTKMVADPGSADAYLNRRTDVFFKIIEE